MLWTVANKIWEQQSERSLAEERESEREKTVNSSSSSSRRKQKIIHTNAFSLLFYIGYIIYDRFVFFCPLFFSLSVFIPFTLSPFLALLSFSALFRQSRQLCSFTHTVHVVDFVRCAAQLVCAYAAETKDNRKTVEKQMFDGLILEFFFKMLLGFEYKITGYGYANTIFQMASTRIATTTTTTTTTTKSTRPK